MQLLTVNLELRVNHYDFCGTSLDVDNFSKPLADFCGTSLDVDKLSKPVSYLRSLVVRAVHQHRTGVGSIPAGGPYS